MQSILHFRKKDLYFSVLLNNYLKDCGKTKSGTEGFGLVLVFWCYPNR